MTEADNSFLTLFLAPVREIYAWKTDSLTADGTQIGHHESRETPTFAEEAALMHLEV